MRTVLKNILQFTGLEVGVPATLPHGLNINGRAMTPNVVTPATGGFTVDVDETEVMVVRTSGGDALDVYVELWHSIEDARPADGISALPFILQPGAGGGGGGGDNTLEFLSNTGDLEVTLDGDVSTSIVQFVEGVPDPITFTLPDSTMDPGFIKRILVIGPGHGVITVEGNVIGNADFPQDQNGCRWLVWAGDFWYPLDPLPAVV